MRKFWLMDQHGSDGPTALVETDGRLQVVRVVRFGPSITTLEDQQQVLDQVIGRVAPTMKPCVKASTVDEQGVEPLPDLRTDDGPGGGSKSRADRRANPGTSGSAGAQNRGPSRAKSRGER